jgi:hypothetical protein
MSNLTDSFKTITGYDISIFFGEYEYFVSNHYSSIIDYYSGLDINQDAFNYFEYLKKESDKVSNLWEMYSNVFELTDFWEMLNTFDNVRVKLNTIDNLNRWLRSSRTDRFSLNTQTTYVQKQGESIEKISRKLGSFDEENDWVKLSIQNDLNEEKYTSQGGVLLNANLSNNFNFDIKNIVDGLTKENLFGKDIQKKIEFTGGDIKTLSGETSLLQTIDTIFSTVKGSIIEFPEDGFENGLIGTNVNAFNYPSLFRNLMAMFQKDDRFQSLELIDLIQEKDLVFLKVQVTTKLGSVYKQQLAI